MAPSKPLRTYKSSNNHLSTSIDVFNTLIAKNLTQRRLIQKRKKPKLKAIPLPPRHETCLSDDSLHVNRNDTFEKIKQGPTYNPVNLIDVNTVTVNGSSESDASRRFEPASFHVSSSLEKTNKSKTNITARSPVVTRLRNRRKRLSLKHVIALAADSASSINVNFSPSSKGSTFFPSLLIEKEKRYIEPAWLCSSFKLPAQINSRDNNSNNNNNSCSEITSAVSSTPVVSNFKKFVMNTLSPLHESTRFNYKEMQKSFEEISDWNHSLSLRTLSPNKSTNRRHKSDSFLIDSRSSRIARKFTKSVPNDRKLLCSPRVILLKTSVNGRSPRSRSPLISASAPINLKPNVKIGSISTLNNSFSRCEIINSTAREIDIKKCKNFSSNSDTSRNKRYELRSRKNHKYSSDLFSSASSSDTQAADHNESSVNSSSDIIKSTPQFVSKRRGNIRAPYVVLDRSDLSDEVRNPSPVIGSSTPLKTCFVVLGNNRLSNIDPRADGAGPRSSTPKTGRDGRVSRSDDASTMDLIDNKSRSGSGSSASNSKQPYVICHRISLENSIKSKSKSNENSIASKSDSRSRSRRYFSDSSGSGSGHGSCRKQCYVVSQRMSLETINKSNGTVRTAVESGCETIEHSDSSSVVSVKNDSRESNRGAEIGNSVEKRSTEHPECYVACQRLSPELSTKSSAIVLGESETIEYSDSAKTDKEYSVKIRSMEQRPDSSKKQCYVVCHRESLENSINSNEKTEVELENEYSVVIRSPERSDRSRQCYVVVERMSLENLTRSHDSSEVINQTNDYDSVECSVRRYSDSSNKECYVVCHQMTHQNLTGSNERLANSSGSGPGACYVVCENMKNLSPNVDCNSESTERESGIFSESPAKRSSRSRGSSSTNELQGVGQGECFVAPAPRPVVPVKPGKSWRRSLAAQVGPSGLPSCYQSRNFGSIERPPVIDRINRDARRSSIKLVPVNKCVTIADDSFLGNVSIREADQRDLEESFKQLSLSSQRPPRATLTGLLDRDLRPDRFVNARDIILQRCGQTEVLPFQGCYPRSILQNCQKIGEGAYGEVFLYRNQNSGTTIMKVIPIEGDLIVNGERQKKYEEILSEILIAMELSNLRRNESNRTSCFTEVCRVLCVRGKYPARLVELWELFDEAKHSENDSPEIFPDDQLYVVLELSNGGTDLEAYYFNNSSQALSVFKQTACALAVAENELEFEHRDLHWGNVLVSTVDRQKKGLFVLGGVDATVATGGVEVTIIDFTLSRMLLDGVVIYNDLSMDPDLFTAKGDYQFDIYRLMQEKNNNNWQNFEPHSNVLWLHYLLTKMVSGLRYKNVNTKTHKLYLKKLKDLKDEILDFASCKDFVQSRFM